VRNHTMQLTKYENVDENAKHKYTSPGRPIKNDRQMRKAFPGCFGMSVESLSCGLKTTGSGRIALTVFRMLVLEDEEPLNVRYSPACTIQ